MRQQGIRTGGHKAGYLSAVIPWTECGVIHTWGCVNSRTSHENSVYVLDSYTER